MEKYTNVELLDVLPVALRETKELTPSQKVLFGQLMIYDGLSKKDSNGFFFRSNVDLCNDCDITEPTLITAIRKLKFLDLIETERGSRGAGASLYKINGNKLKEYCNINTHDVCNSYSNDLLRVTDKIKEIEILLKKSNKEFSNNFSTDTDKELEIDEEIETVIYNILNNSSKKVLLDKLNDILEEALNSKQTEEKESIEKVIVSQTVYVESQVAEPIEKVSQSSSISNSTELNTPTEETTIPSEEEQYQQLLHVVTPFLMKFDESGDCLELNGIFQEMCEVVYDYLDDHNISSSVQERIDKYVTGVYKTRFRLLKNNSN